MPLNWCRWTEKRGQVHKHEPHTPHRYLGSHTLWRHRPWHEQIDEEQLDLDLYTQGAGVGWCELIELWENITIPIRWCVTPRWSAGWNCQLDMWSVLCVYYAVCSFYVRALPLFEHHICNNWTRAQHSTSYPIIKYVQCSILQPCEILEIN